MFRNSKNKNSNITIMGKEFTNNSSYNILTHGSKMEGNITADSDFRVDGFIKGTINCSGKVVVGEQGLVDGNIVCASAEIMGEIKGNVIASDTLTLKSTSKMSGEIKIHTLAIEAGAIFVGTCEMGKNETLKEQKG